MEESPSLCVLCCCMYEEGSSSQLLLPWCRSLAREEETRRRLLQHQGQQAARATGLLVVNLIDRSRKASRRRRAGCPTRTAAGCGDGGVDVARVESGRARKSVLRPTHSQIHVPSSPLHAVCTGQPPCFALSKAQALSNQEDSGLFERGFASNQRPASITRRTHHIIHAQERRRVSFPGFTRAAQAAVSSSVCGRQAKAKANSRRQQIMGNAESTKVSLAVRTERVSYQAGETVGGVCECIPTGAIRSRSLSDARGEWVYGGGGPGRARIN
jgi:hypothetical protein